MSRKAIQCRLQMIGQNQRWITTGRRNKTVENIIL
jgi:hypothetical protein